MATIKHFFNKRNQNYELSLYNAAKNRDLEGVMSALKNGADVNYRDKDQETALYHASTNRHIEIVQLLLQHQADPNICNKDQITALCYASTNGYTEIVQILLKYKADPNIYNKDQETALHWASCKGHTEIVQLLLQHQADPNICTTYQWTALQEASRNGHTEIVQLLLKYNADPNICDKYQWTALHWASSNGHTEIVQLLLKYNADPNICDEDQQTALHRASYKGHAEIVQLLLTYNADPNICKKYQWTALFWASFKDHTDIVQLLLQHVADPNICNTYQWTALFWASRNGYTEIVQLLLKSKADPNICNEDQETAIHWASYNGHTEIVQLLLQHKADPNICDKNQLTSLYQASYKGHTEIVQLLLKYNADPNICDKYQQTASHRASSNGHTEIVQLLLKYKADPNICDKYQQTALHWASSNGHTEIVQLLLKYNADPNICNKYQQTALHRASYKGHTEILLKSNADLNSCDKEQETALHWALGKGYTEIVQLLLKHQTDPNICDMYGDTALHIACSEGNLNVISCLLSEGADVTVKNNNGNTPLERCQDTIRNEIFSLFAKYNPKRVLEDVSKWNIEYVEEDQVFEKKEYGVMLVIPPSAVKKKEEVKTEVKVVAPEEIDIILPPDVELVSCFYKIETTGKFSKPIELYLQHNVELTSQEECQQLAFIKAKGPPPYKFELLPTEGQEFRPYDNSGVVRLCDFSPVAVVYLKKKFKKIKSALFRQPSYSYIVTVFVKQMRKSCWEIKAVVTKNLGPFLKSTEACFESWKRIEPVSFFFDPVINEVTITNEYYDIKPMINPFQVSKKVVDKCQPDTALPYLKFQAFLKDDKEVIDLKLSFKGMREEASLMIASYDLQQIKDIPASSSLSTSQPSTTSILPSPTSTTFPVSPNSIGSTPSPVDNQSSIGTPPIVSDPFPYSTECSCKLNIPNDLLCKVPKKHHLMMLLHPIKYKWDTIGEQLKVNFGDIKSAEYNEAYDHTRKLSEVLQVWIDKRTSLVCWKTIITVVEEPPVENKVVADDIYQFLTRPDIQNEYLSSHRHTGQLITTFNSPPQIAPKPTTKKGRPVSTPIRPPIAPKPATKKGRSLSYHPPPIAPKPTKKKVEIDEMEQEAPLQSSNPIGFAAHCLHKQAKQWEEKDNDMIVATKRMARLMMKMSKFANDEVGEVTSKEDFMETATLIITESEEVIKMAKKVATICKDEKINKSLVQSYEKIETIAHQLQANVSVENTRQKGKNPKEDKEATELLTVNAENLMSAVSEVLSITKSAIITVPHENHGQLTGLMSWVKSSAEATSP